MASISNDPNGRRRILFMNAHGKRKTIRLGKVSHRHAESVKLKVEDLASSSINHNPPRDDTSRWLASLDSVLYDKLAKVGLTKPREVATLGPFTRSYIDGRSDIKQRTRINLERVRTYLLDCFEADRPLRDFTEGDADDFRQHLIRQGKAENTVRRAIGRARQFFKAAQKRKLIDQNPFEGLVASVRANTSRFHFISRQDAAKVLAACPDSQWRLIFALARFGGLRCPSEILSLTWSDINWEEDRIRVPSPKTEHHEGKESRLIPLYPELREPLLEAFDEAEPGTEFVITRYRAQSTNLRTQLHRIIVRAGLEPWPKTFQNLRSTRETELAEHYPMHVVCAWIGNSQPVAAQHYLQLTDSHFERAVQDSELLSETKAAQNAAQNMHETTRITKKSKRSGHSKTPCFAGKNEQFPTVSATFKNEKMPPEGLEPSTG